MGKPNANNIEFDNSAERGNSLGILSRNLQDLGEEITYRKDHVIHVNKSHYPGHFSTLKAALDSVIDGNPAVITMGPGVYVEDNAAGPLTLKPGVTVKADGHGTVTIEPQDPTKDLILVDQNNCRFQGITLRNVTAAIALKVVASSTPAIFDFVTISNCKQPIYVESNAAVTQAVLRNVRLISGSTTTDLLTVKSLAGLDCIVRIYSAIITDDNGTAFLSAVRVSGSGARIDPNSVLVRSTVGVGAGMVVENGGHVVLAVGMEISGFANGIHSPAGGVAPKFNVISVAMLVNTVDLRIEHATTFGSILGVFQRSKIINNATTTLLLGYADPVTGDLNSTRILATRGFATDLTTIISSGSITQMISFDAHTYVVTGTTPGEILRLPDATTLRNGHQFWIINASTQYMTVQQFGGTESNVLSPTSTVHYVLRDNGTQAGVWSKSVSTSSLFSGATTLLGYYGGAANTGRYLEFFPGSDSLESSYLVPTPGTLIALTLGSSAATTGAVGIFKKADLVNPILTLGLVSQMSNKVINQVIPLFPEDEIVARVTSGSINKPRIAIYMAGA